MFNRRKTKIVSTPVEEVLEVSPAETTLDPVTVIESVYNIDYITIDEEDNETSSGFLIDTASERYHFFWDKKLKRISSLHAKKVDSLRWNLCEAILRKYYIKQEKEEPVELKIVEALKVALAPINQNIKALENKIERSTSNRTAVTQAPVQSAPRPQTVQSMPIDTPAMSVADDDISSNALKYLQQSPSDDLGVDYLSL
jgi:hypothetical protein